MRQTGTLSLRAPALTQPRTPPSSEKTLDSPGQVPRQVLTGPVWSMPGGSRPWKQAVLHHLPAPNLCTWTSTSLSGEASWGRTSEDESILWGPVCSARQCSRSCALGKPWGAGKSGSFLGEHLLTSGSPSISPTKRDVCKPTCSCPRFWGGWWCVS